MAVLIKKVGVDENDLPVFEATDLATGDQVEVKNWFEKSKNKWHIVMKANSANRKYVAHNEFETNKNADDEYVVEDKTTGPRSLGTSQPDKNLVPYMTAEDKETYDAIIARAIENRNAQKAAEKSSMTEEEKLEARIAALQAKLAAAKAKQSADEK